MNYIFGILIGLNKYKWTVPLIALYIIAIPFQRILRFDIIEYKIQITEIIYLLICLSFLFATRIKDVLKFSENTNRIDISILIWLAVGIINLLIHQNISTFIELIGQCYLITLYFILRIILTTLENVGNIMSFYVQSFTLMGIAIFAVVVIGIVFYLFGNDIGVFWKFKDYPYFGTLYRLKAFTNEPVMLSSILSTTFIFYVGSKMENNKTVLNKRELLLIIIIGLMLLFTFSKSLSCLFIVLIVFTINNYSLNKKIKYFLGLIAFVVFFSYLFMSHLILTKNENRTGEGYGMEQPQFQYNSYFIYKTWYLVQKENALKLFNENPIFGVGGGNMVNILTKDFEIKAKNTYNNSTYDPLSTYTGVMAEYGLLGIVGLFFLILSIYFSFAPHYTITSGLWLFAGIFCYFSLEAICTDIMNFRHLWITLAFFSTIISFISLQRES